MIQWTETDAREAMELAQMLHGHSPGIQGGALADLVATWVAVAAGRAADPVCASRLLASKTISLKTVKTLSEACTCDTLLAAVETARKEGR